MDITADEMLMIYENEHPELTIVDWQNEPSGGIFEDEYFDYEAVLYHNNTNTYWRASGCVSSAFLEGLDTYETFHDDVDVVQVEPHQVIHVEFVEINDKTKESIQRGLDDLASGRLVKRDTDNRSD